MKIKVPTWEQVTKNPDKDLRQSYLDSIAPLLPDGSDGFMYMHEPRAFLYHINNMTALRLIEPDHSSNLWKEYITDQKEISPRIAFHVIRSPALYADGKNHPILTFPAAFNIFPEERVFKTIAVHHEGSHVFLRKHGMYINKQQITREEVHAMNPKTFEAIDEYAALLDLQKGIREENLPESQFAPLVDSKMEKYRMLALNYILFK